MKKNRKKAWQWSTRLVPNSNVFLHKPKGLVEHIFIGTEIASIFHCAELDVMRMETDKQ